MHPIDTLISILIPNYNKASYLRETLDSILQQTHTNWECIIVDDHSTDNCWEILEEYTAKDSRFKIYKRPKHLVKGGNACRNYAFELSKGDYIQWFDGDDFLHKTALEERFNAIGKKYDFVISHGFYGEANFKFINDLISPVLYKDYVESFFILDPPYLPQSMLIRKSFLHVNSISWDISIFISQDIQYNIDVLMFNPNYSIVKQNPDWSYREIVDGKNVGSTGRKPQLIKSYLFFILHLKRYKGNINKLRIKKAVYIIFNRYNKKPPYRLINNYLFPLYLKGVISFFEFISYFIIILLKRLSINKGLIFVEGWLKYKLNLNNMTPLYRKAKINDLNFNKK